VRVVVKRFAGPEGPGVQTKEQAKVFPWEIVTVFDMALNLRGRAIPKEGVSLAGP
jgi:hypothetical protein